jgi:group I intron endonuclease
MTSGIYQIINTTNGKIYIGSSKNIEQRWWAHRSKLRANKHHNPHLQNAYNKYGINVFQISFLEVCTLGDLIVIEQYYLDWLEPFEDRGYNLARIAKAPGQNPSPETREKLRVAGKKRIWSQATRTKISNSLKGRKMSAIAKAKLLAANLGKYHTKEHNTKVSVANKGRVVSEATRKKISDAQCGEKGNHFGRPIDEATKEKISNALKGRSPSNKGKLESKEAVAKRVFANTGKKRTVETREKMRKAQKKRRLNERLTTDLQTTN